jgi:hypothetical protein
MCHPALVVAGVVSAVSTGLQVTSTVQQAQAQQEANERAADWAMKQRALEVSQIQTARNQKAQEAALKDRDTTIAAMEAMGDVGAQSAETGLTGNFLKAIARNVDMQTARRRGQDTATYQWASEASNLQIGAANFRAEKEIALLPEVPSIGAAIAGGVLGGISTGISAGSNFTTGDGLEGWGFK